MKKWKKESIRKNKLNEEGTRREPKKDKKKQKRKGVIKKLTLFGIEN